MRVPLNFIVLLHLTFYRDGRIRRFAASEHSLRRLFGSVLEIQGRHPIRPLLLGAGHQELPTVSPRCQPASHFGLEQHSTC